MNKTFDRTKIFHPETGKSILRVISLFLAGCAATVTLYRFFFEISQVNAIFYDLIKVKNSPLPLWVAAAGAVLAILYPAISPSQFHDRLRKCEKVCRPLLCLWFIPLTFPYAVLTGFVFGWVFFNAVSQSDLKIPEFSPKITAAVITLLTLSAVYWGYFLQNSAYNSLYFIYGDWNQYVDHYHYLAGGNGGLFQWFSGAGHWNFGVNILMTVLLKYADAPDTVFLVNALAIASAIPLSYILMRKSNCGSTASLILAITVMLNPALSHQYLAHFYGFHPIIFFIPVILGFFICKENNNRIGMSILFLLSLLIQETVAIFWAGYALYLFTEKKWKTALLLFITSVLFFFCTTSFIIPRSAIAATSGVYAQNFHFAHLGNNLPEMLLSPFTRPGAFFGTLFHSSTFSFLLCVLIPLAWAAIFSPRLLLAGLPIAAGICLQKNPEMKSVMLQYSVELTTLCVAAAAAALKKADPSGKPMLRNAMLAAILVSTLFSLILYGFIPGGKERASMILNRKKADKLTSFIRESIGENPHRLIATSRIRGFFQFEYPSYGINTPYESGDIIVLDLNDPSVDSQQTIGDLRKKILSDRKAVPLTYAVFENNTHVIFKILDHPVPPVPLPFLRLMPPEAFAALGDNVAGVPENYSLRIKRNGTKNICCFRINKAVNCDLELLFQVRGSDDSIKDIRVMFAHGLVPAYAMPAGVVFTFSFDSPPIKELKMDIRENTL